MNPSQSDEFFENRDFPAKKITILKNSRLTLQGTITWIVYMLIARE